MTQDLIRLLRDAPVDEERLAEVRRRVLLKVDARRPGPGRWILAGALSSLLLAVVLWPTTLKLDAPVIAWSAPAPPEWALERPVGARHAEPRRAVAPPRTVRESEITVVAVEENAAMLQIPTSNPDVVLYWLVDGGGE